MKRESIAGSSVRVSRWRVVKQISQFANYEHLYADNTHLALPPAAMGRTAVERRPYQADFAQCGGSRRVLKRRANEPSAGLRPLLAHDGHQGDIAA